MMLKMDAQKSAGGIGGSEWITPTNASGTKWSAEWDFDADTVYIMYTYNNIKYVMLADTTPSAWYASSSSSYWSVYTVGTSITWTGKRKIEIDFGIALTNVSICPMVGKPNGYFA